MRGGLDGECGHRAEGEGEEEWYDMRCMSCSSTVRPRSLFAPALCSPPLSVCPRSLFAPALCSPLAARKNFTQHGSDDTVFLFKTSNGFSVHLNS